MVDNMWKKLTEERARGIFGVGKEDIIRGIDDGTFKKGRKIGDAYQVEIVDKNDIVQEESKIENGENKEVIDIDALKIENEILRHEVLVNKVSIELNRELEDDLFNNNSKKFGKVSESIYKVLWEQKKKELLIRDSLNS